MESPNTKQDGMVAILDALGAASYSDGEIEKFLKSREVALTLLGEKIDGVGRKIHADQVDIFTFNDTIVIVLKTGKNPPGFEEIIEFFGILRKFLVDSLVNNILFRGSVAIGTFYADTQSNTVMGQAVTDAAAWYDKAEWIGLQGTPRTTILIQRWMEKASKKREHLMLDYPVPLKGGDVVSVKAVNWPKVFLVPTLSPCKPGQKPRERFLEALSAHRVPLGTEKKFANTIAFFDHALKEIAKDEKSTRKASIPTPPRATIRPPAPASRR